MCDVIKIVEVNGKKNEVVLRSLKSGNHFGENVTGIHTATPYTLTDTSIMLRRRNNTTRVDLAPISPLTASYASKVFDRRSPDGEIWEQSINSIGTLQSPNKLL